MYTINYAKYGVVFTQNDATDGVICHSALLPLNSAMSNHFILLGNRNASDSSKDGVTAAIFQANVRSNNYSEAISIMNQLRAGGSHSAIVDQPKFFNEDANRRVPDDSLLDWARFSNALLSTPCNGWSGRLLVTRGGETLYDVPFDLVQERNDEDEFNNGLTALTTKIAAALVAAGLPNTDFNGTTVTVDDGAGNVGDATVVLTITPPPGLFAPGGWEGPGLTNLGISYTHEGSAGDALVVSFLSGWIFPAIIVKGVSDHQYPFLTGDRYDDLS